LVAAHSTLEHAIEAGRLLAEVKAALPHGALGPWLEANFDGSERTARAYMRLHARREELSQNGSTVAVLSIRDALKALAAPCSQGPPPVPGTVPLTPEQERGRRAKERKHQRRLQRAEFAIRSGNLEPPPDLSANDAAAWQQVLYEALALRGQNISNVIDALGHSLHILVNHADPEAVGRYLVEARVGYEEAEKRADQLAELREGAAWLQRVLDACKAVHIYPSV